MKILRASRRGDYYFESLELPQTDTDIDNMYNQNVKDFHSNMMITIIDDNPGLYILHGPPGTGKTSYIKHLITSVNKSFLFIPNTLVDALASPDFISILHEHKNSIMIVEDAEKALQKRSSNEYSPVSNLLNLTDGILGDVLNMQVICTLNSPLTIIDEALLRKGRLKGKCYIGELEAEKANQLSKKLGHNQHFSSKTSLSDVFNTTSNTFDDGAQRKLGFVG